MAAAAVLKAHLPSIAFHNSQPEQANLIGKISDIATSLSIVYFNNAEEKLKLEKEVSVWLSDLESLESTFGDSEERVDLLFNDEEPPELGLISDSEDVLRSTKASFSSENKNIYFAAEDLTGTLQGVCVMNTEFDQLKYLATAPANLPIAANPSPLRGVGTRLIREAVRLCFANGKSVIDTFPTVSARNYYLHLGFIPRDYNPKSHWLYLPVNLK